LTLNQARHVFLLEPQTNPSLETQAINRVHRIGQTQETYVYKFYIRATVEEKVLRLMDAKSKESASRMQDDETKDVLRFDELEKMLS
jgi:E3 ubiquitin-protein ligase SHPRH